MDASFEYDQDPEKPIALRGDGGALVARLSYLEGATLREDLNVALESESVRRATERMAIADELAKMPAAEVAELKRLLAERKGK